MNKETQNNHTEYGTYHPSQCLPDWLTVCPPQLVAAHGYHLAAAPKPCLSDMRHMNEQAQCTKDVRIRERCL